MKAATTVREGAEDVYADAKDINEARLAAQEAAVVEDASENGSARSRITASPKDRFRGPSELPKKLPLSRQKNAPRLRA